MLLRKSEESEARILTAVGIIAMTAAAVAATIIFSVKSFGSHADDQIAVTINTPYVGQGVAKGTAVLLDGVKIGEITAVDTRPGKGITLGANLQRRPVAGFTVNTGIDFRPANYFGVTGVNLRPEPGGAPLVNGSVISTVPAGNFTIQTMLSDVGKLSDTVVTPQLVKVIDRGTRFAQGLDPLVETIFTVSTTVANVQTVSTAQLLNNIARISVAAPEFIDSLLTAGDLWVHTDLDDKSEDFFQNRFMATINLSASELFGAVGRLQSDYSTQLVATTEPIKLIADIIPALVPPEAIRDTLHELRSRLERMFAGTPEQRAIQVRVVLDSLPGVAAPIDAIGGAP